ncbi:MAG: hypothetical protein K2M43_02480 [Mycoplasmoidaceae bacterium]|nr:hypothetical protein [Mycoplasmoidaceae bacterium]
MQRYKGLGEMSAEQL